MKRRDEPCPRCGFKWEGFHICVDLSTPEPAPPPVKKTKKKPTSATERLSGGSTRGSEEWKQKVQDSLKEHREAETERLDRRMREFAKLYNDGMDQKEIAERYELHEQTVRRQLWQARDMGLVELRRVVPKPSLEIADRNTKIVQMYKDGGTIKSIALEIGIRYQTCAKVLYDARDRGVLELRKR